MEKTKERKLDISREYCHSCGGQLTRDLDRQKEKCTVPACAIYGVEFTIPFADVEDPREGKEEKQNAEKTE